MNYTEHYQLSQFEKDDRIQMEDFNADNEKIETAILDAQPAIGSYVGSGPSNWHKIELGFRPRAVIISAGWTGISTTGNLQRMFIYLPDCTAAYLTINETGFSVFQTGSTTNGTPNLNEKNVHYGYLAFR